MDDVNPNGGGISLGHPLGATGARMTATLLERARAARRALRRGDDVHRLRPGDRRGRSRRLRRKVGELGYRSARASTIAAWRSLASASSASARWAPGSRRSACRPGSRSSAARSSPSSASGRVSRIDHYLGRGVEKERLTQEEKDAALGRLTSDRRSSPTSLTCQLVIEAAFEDLGVKRELFGELDRHRRAGRDPRDEHLGALRHRRSLDATSVPSAWSACTSSTRHRCCRSSRSIRTAHTSDEAFDAAYAFAQRIGKEPVGLQRHAGLHRQPDPDPAPERLRAGARRGAVEPGRRRPRDALRRRTGRSAHAR